MTSPDRLQDLAARWGDAGQGGVVTRPRRSQHRHPAVQNYILAGRQVLIPSKP